MLDFIRELINLRRDKKCETCEILKRELALVQQERDKLLDRLLETPKPQLEEAPELDYNALKPRHIPWNVRQQVLERESRISAQKVKDKAKEVEEAKKSTATTEDREKLVVGE